MSPIEGLGGLPGGASPRSQNLPHRVLAAVPVLDDEAERFLEFGSVAETVQRPLDACPVVGGAPLAVARADGPLGLRAAVGERRRLGRILERVDEPVERQHGRLELPLRGFAPAARAVALLLQAFLELLVHALWGNGAGGDGCFTEGIHCL